MSKALKITGRVQHGRIVDGEKVRVILNPGDIITQDDDRGLSDADIERIVRGNCGVVFDPDAVQEEQQTDEIDSDRLSELVDAIGELEDGNEAHWTSGGKPEVSALKEITGGKVTAAERDAAWTAFKGENK